MAKIVRQARRFSNVGVDATECVGFVRLLAQELLGETASQLSYFERMREAVVENMSALGPDYLRDLGKPRERRRV